ncbi:MAG: hypothetical protein KF830_09695 [Planctomycetes bacterium]|nr:hypothetical protein [Planctomycetota bacterium]
MVVLFALALAGGYGLHRANFGATIGPGAATVSAPSGNQADPERATAAASEGGPRFDAATSADAPSGGIVLMDAGSGERLPQLQIACSPAGGAPNSPRPRRSDGDGCVPLSPGIWRIDASIAGFGPPDLEVAVADDLQCVWLQRVVEFVVRVLDPVREPIPGAGAVLFDGGDSVRTALATGHDGTTEILQTWLAPGLRIQVSHPAYEPACVAVDQGLSSRVLDVHLQPCRTAWTLRACDATQVPMSGVTFAARPATGSAPAVPLGSTGVDGTLVVHGDWMFDGCHWFFAGAAYDYRCTPPVPRDVGVDSEIVVALPRRIAGSLAVAGTADGPVRWRFLEPEPDPSGSGILARILEQPAVTRLVPTDLPADRPVLVECLAGGTLISQQRIRVGAPGWSLPVVLDVPAATRRLYLRSPVAALLRIDHGGRSTAAQHSIVGRGNGTHALQVDVTRGGATVLATFAGGAQALLVGEPGADDVVLTVGPPPLVPVEVALQDGQGQPVRDVVLRMSRATSGELAATDAPGWRSMDCGSVFWLRAGPDGLARHDLPAARYDLEIEHLAVRDSLGAGWPPGNPGFVEVVAPGPARFVVTVPRPRRVRIELECDGRGVLPGRWQLAVGAGSVLLGGTACEAWLTESEQEVRILDLRHRELGAARLPPGREPAEVRIRLAEPR